MAAGSALALVAAAVCLAFAVLAPAVSGDGATLESVPDLVKAMYLNIESFPCVRLLNLSGEIGCSNPGSEKIIAPIVRLTKGSDQLVQPSTVLLPLDQMSGFLLRVSNDPEFHQKVSGVLIESNGANNNLQELSPDRKFPQDAFAPYSNRSHDWNPAGSGIMWNRYDFPVFLLSEESTRILQKVFSVLLCNVHFMFKVPVQSLILCYILMMTVNKRFLKRIRRLTMDIKQTLQNSTLLCRQLKLKHMIQHPASKSGHACP
jgi:nicastrin